jgi:hypothetical protein
MSEQDSGQMTRTDRELLLSLKDQLRFLREELKEREELRQQQMKQTVFTPIQDHEARIRILENFRWWIVGAIAVSNGAAALFGKYLH